jgi:hypothetical protein
LLLLLAKISYQKGIPKVQTKTIRDFLLSEEGARIKYLWFDYWCMPQGKRTRAEKVLFKWMLSNVNLLYLGARVLLVVDISYLSRFWTQFEAWLSMQTTSSQGLLAAPADERRCTIVCTHNASAGSEDEKLIKMWSHATAEDARKVLKSNDVVVTNQGDKDQQLHKTGNLNDEVRAAFDAKSFIRLHQHGSAPSQLQTLGFSLEVIAEAAKETSRTAWQLKERGYTAAQLKATGYSGVELKEVGYTPLQLYEIGYTTEQLKELGYSAAQMEDVAMYTKGPQVCGYHNKRYKDGSQVC